MEYKTIGSTDIVYLKVRYIDTRRVTYTVLSDLIFKEILN